MGMPEPVRRHGASASGEALSADHGDASHAAAINRSMDAARPLNHYRPPVQAAARNATTGATMRQETLSAADPNAAPYRTSICHGAFMTAAALMSALALTLLSSETAQAQRLTQCGKGRETCRSMCQPGGAGGHCRIGCDHQYGACQRQQPQASNWQHGDFAKTKTKTGTPATSIGTYSNKRSSDPSGATPVLRSGGGFGRGKR